MTKIDDQDIAILKYLGSLNLPVTTTDVAKELFDINDNYQLRSKDNLIRTRLKKLTKLNLVIIKIDETHANYYLSENCLYLCGKLNMSIDDKVFEGEEGEYILIFDNNNLSQILS